jgi:GNAT superfamily N-acetyltransferase
MSGLSGYSDFLGNSEIMETMNLELKTAPQIIIRAAVPADVEILTALLRTLFAIEKDFTFDEETQRRGLQMMLYHDRGCLLVAEVEDRLIGMCSGQLTISTAEGGPALLIEDVVIERGWRGKGVGRRLMTEVCNWARTHHNISLLQLLADRHNANALAFYKKLGWQTTELICLRRKA